MTRFAYGIGIGVIALMVAGCASSGPADQPDGAAAPQTQTDTSSPGDPAVEVAAPDDPCALYDGIDLDSLINTTAGDVSSTDDECSFGPADSGEVASSSITLGSAAAIEVFRGLYDGGAYNCEVVDIEGLGDEAFSCFGGRASSAVVFTEGEVMVILSAGNSASGPPADSIMIDVAQQISTNLRR
jgi:hypothetical protein